MIRVLLVDDDALVRAGLRLMLASANDITVVAEAQDGTEVTDLVAHHQPDLVLMDIRMPGMDGLEATRLLRARPGAPEIVMLTTFTTDGYVLKALQAGAAGFLLKHTPPHQIIDAVRRAATGEPVMSPDALGQLITAATASTPRQPAPAALTHADAQQQLDQLGAREREVALAVSQGRTNAEIAAELYMSVPTVKSHISHILARLELNNRVQIALLVYRAGRL
ncbi:response regulator transcription factor [Streptomyces sp. NPDC001904]|uniref:response regulator transcription factor n=1 Tax=Streptomyces sp. NPDC001904 TaxID=3154531 RepID=UPI0033299F2E